MKFESTQKELEQYKQAFISAQAEANCYREISKKSEEFIDTAQDNTKIQAFKDFKKQRKEEF